MYIVGISSYNGLEVLFVNMDDGYYEEGSNNTGYYYYNEEDIIFYKNWEPDLISGSDEWEYEENSLNVREFDNKEAAEKLLIKNIW